jgi:hypothetical protein
MRGPDTSAPFRFYKLLERPPPQSSAAMPSLGALAEPLRRTRTDNPKNGGTQRGRRAAAQVIRGMISSATMFATLIIGLIAGPAVSL